MTSLEAAQEQELPQGTKHVPEMSVDFTQGATELVNEFCLHKGGWGR